MDHVPQVHRLHPSDDLLDIALLGPPLLTYAGCPLALPRRQMRALVFRLAAAGQPLSRDHLCFLLWSDSAESTARRNLSVLLNQLRSTLPSPDMLVVQRETVALDDRRVRVDVARLDAAMRGAHRDAHLEPLAVATALYRGPFMHGFALPSSAEFDAWAERERQHWERRYLDALALLVEAYAERGAYAEAIRAARLALRVDELAEEMHRRLIELYAAAGDRTAALRQFEQCAAVLERELDVSPLPETIAVADAVREGRAIRRASGTLRYTAPEPETMPVGERATLPAIATPTLGRTRELAQVLAMLDAPDARLVTLCGAGGSGKTRLALLAAWQQQEERGARVVFVALAALRDAALMPDAIGRACGLRQADLAAIAAQMRGTRTLLVLDNCEHLPAAAHIATLLASTPDLRVLATSRTTIHVQGEHLFPVLPLPTPSLHQLPTLAELAAVPSVALLVARTRALDPQFALRSENAQALAEICVRLDGLPLAIELAAARLRLLAPRDLVRRLDHRLALLTGGTRDVPDRQRTLHATIDWSYRLLSVPQQRLLGRCAVFVGGWTLHAAHAIDAHLHGDHGRDDAALLDALAALVDQSLVQAHVADDGATRFTMLQTIREFAADTLHAQGMSEAVGWAHATYFATFIQHMQERGVAQNTPPWVAAIERDHDNMRAALRWLLDHDGIEQAIALGSMLQNYWYWREGEREGLRWLREIVARSAHLHTLDRAQLVHKAGLLATAQGNIEEAVAHYETVLRMCETLPLATLHASSRAALGITIYRQGEHRRGIALLEEAVQIVEQLGNRRFIGSMSLDLAGVLADQGEEMERAIALYERSWLIAREFDEQILQTMALCGMGLALAFTGNTVRGAELMHEALRIQQELNATGIIGWTYQFMGMVAYLQADYGHAQQCFLRSLRIAADSESLNTVPMSVEGLAGVMAQRRQPIRAARLLGGAETVRETLQIALPPLERPYYDGIVAAVRAQLLAATMEATWQSGRRLTLKQIIAEALQCDDAPSGEALKRLSV